MSRCTKPSPAQGSSHARFFRTSAARPSFRPASSVRSATKTATAVALVARDEPRDVRVGVDIETDAPRATDIARMVLTEDEELELAPLSPAERSREVLLRFSAKEAVYKALDPFVRRYVGFKEVSVSPRPDGSAGVVAHLADVPPGTVFDRGAMGAPPPWHHPDDGACSRHPSLSEGANVYSAAISGLSPIAGASSSGTSSRAAALLASSRRWSWSFAMRT